jgi:hypothetical protein
MNKLVIIGIVVILIIVVAIVVMMMQKKPVDCKMSDWTQWGACSKTCGGGTQTRTRTVTTPAANGGVACPALTDTSNCNVQPCPVDCVGSWSNWGECDAKCGTGMRNRIYSVSRAAEHGGQACPVPDRAIASEPCDTQKTCQTIEKPDPYTTIIYGIGDTPKITTSSTTQPIVIKNVQEPVLTSNIATFEKVRIHNTWAGGFFFIYHTASWDLENKNMIKNIASLMKSFNSMKVTGISSLEYKLEDLTDVDNKPIPSLKIMEVNVAPEVADAYVYVTVKYDPPIMLREHKLISFVIQP